MELFVSIVWCLLWASTITLSLGLINRWLMLIIVAFSTKEGRAVVDPLHVTVTALGWAVIIVFWFN